MKNLFPSAFPRPFYGLFILFLLLGTGFSAWSQGPDPIGNALDAAISSSADSVNEVAEIAYMLDSSQAEQFRTGIFTALSRVPEDCPPWVWETPHERRKFFFINISLSILLSLLFVITALTFLWSRLKRKESDFHRVLEAFGINEQEAGLLEPSVSNYFKVKDYIFPVLFCFGMTLVGFLSIFIGTQLATTEPIRPNAFYTGTILAHDAKSCELILIKLEGLRVLGYGFLGAFIWGAQIVIRRLISGDLTPGVYYNVTFRMIMAPILAILVMFCLRSVVINGKVWPMEMLPVMAVLTGLFPEQVIAWLKERVFIFSKRRNRYADALPLDMIEGMNIFHKARLNELGIDNAQNLAKANLIELIIRTPFEPRMLIDWIAQARLYIYTKDEIVSLRDAGIRTIFDLVEACENAEELEAVASLTGVSAVKLNLLAQRFHQDENLVRLKGFESKLSLH